MDKNNNFCFCTLALGKPYRLQPKNLIEDLERYASNHKVIVGTDYPSFLNNYPNVVAFPHKQKGTLHCYHDKRFAIEKSLESFQAAIFTDSDARIVDKVPEDIAWPPGISTHTENLVEHVSKFPPNSLNNEKLASKLEISLDKTEWIGEPYFLYQKMGQRNRIPGLSGSDWALFRTKRSSCKNRGCYGVSGS